MKRFITVVLFLAIVIPVQGRAEDIIQKGELLNLQRAIEIAVMKHPAIAAAKGTASANQTLIGQAQANYYPQLNWSGSYNRISSVARLTNVPTVSVPGSTGGAQSGTFDQYSTSFGLHRIFTTSEGPRTR